MDKPAATQTAAESLLIVATLLGGLACARKPAVPTAPVPAATAPEYVIIVNNTTAANVAVYIAEDKSHTRIGAVSPRTESRIEVKPFFLRRSTRFRVYMFRGPEPCPVARVVDFGVSRTPRVTVLQSDTVVSGYLPADGCRSGIR